MCFERYVVLCCKIVLPREVTFGLDIRKFYPINKGKSPDWILIDGSTASFLSVKRLVFLGTHAIASEDAVNNSLAQVKKGISN
jgi:hypothetical protein